MAHDAPELKISQFEGPLDLLCHLIEKNKIDIYDIPIAEITDQYISYLSSLQELNLELASDFLLMASTLLHIKSRMLLPQRQRDSRDSELDPREELVLRLLEYRRCRTLAADLKNRHEQYRDTMLKLPEPPARLDLNMQPDPGRLNWDLFLEACDHMSRRNRARFQDQRAGLTQILRREKVSLKDKMRQIWRAIAAKSRVFFSELYPAGQASRAEQVTGFLALLELLRLNRIRVRQEHAFDVIMIEKNPVQTGDEAILESNLATLEVEEKAYD
ncbi:MAG: segregation/condensation protein A [Ruminococcaceae bacterium]|nr:segregation/condensation protein A [Oscillospiraceae bacterium]